MEDENGSRAVAARATGGPRTQRHHEKASLALKLHQDHGLRDMSERLTELSDLRKDVSYGEPGDDLGEVDLEDLVSEVESFIEEVERLISAQEKAS